MSTELPGIPVDWTNGTGVFPGSGTIVLPANPSRAWFFCQSQDVGAVTVTLVSEKASDATACSTVLYLAAGTSSGSHGASLEFVRSQFDMTCAITITGTVGQKVCVMEAI